MRIVGHVAGDDLVEQHDLGIGEQHAEFGAGQRLAARLALGKRCRRRQVLDLAVEQAARLERRHEAHLVREVGQCRPCARRRAPASAGSCWRARARATSSVISASSLSRAGRVSAPLRMAEASAILMLTSTSERVDAARIVDGVGIAGAAVAGRIRCAPRWVTPRLAPSPMTLARTSAAVTRIASLARSPTSWLVSLLALT